MVELSNNYYGFFENEKKINITINRYYDNFKDVGVFYRLLTFNKNTNFLNLDLTKINNDNLFNKINNRNGFVIFKDGENSKNITIDIFADFFLENKEIKLIFEIFNPFGGCYLGKITRSVIEIFDELLFADLYASYFVLTGNSIIDNDNQIIYLYII